jgi:hypothetical protein
LLKHAVGILHNFVRKHDGICFDGTLYECPLDNINAVGTRGNIKGIQIRDYFSIISPPLKGLFNGNTTKFDFIFVYDLIILLIICE